MYIYLPSKNCRRMSNIEVDDETHSINLLIVCVRTINGMVGKGAGFDWVPILSRPE